MHRKGPGPSNLFGLDENPDGYTTKTNSASQLCSTPITNTPLHLSHVLKC